MIASEEAVMGLVLEIGGKVPSQLYLIQLDQMLTVARNDLESNVKDFYAEFVLAAGQQRPVRVHFLSANAKALPQIDEIAQFLNKENVYFRYTLKTLAQTGFVCSRVNNDGVYHLRLMDDKPVFTYDELMDAAHDGFVPVKDIRHEIAMASAKVPPLVLPDN